MFTSPLSEEAAGATVANRSKSECKIHCSLAPTGALSDSVLLYVYDPQPLFEILSISANIYSSHSSLSPFSPLSSVSSFSSLSFISSVSSVYFSFLFFSSFFFLAPTGAHIVIVPY